MEMVVPAVPGGTAQWKVTYPQGAVGNLNALLWSGQFAGSVSPTIPGYTVQGQVRVDPINFLATDLGAFGSSLERTFALAIPNHPSFLGLGLDVQSLDLSAVTPQLFLADDEVDLVVSSGLHRVHIAQATTTSTITGDNDIQQITDTTIGAPVSQGIPPFAYLPTFHRGDEGYVEGYSGEGSLVSHNSDIDSVSGRRVARFTANLSYTGISCPNGFDISLIRDCTNRRQFGVLSHDRVTGATRIVPGTTWVDTGTSAQPPQRTFHLAVSRDGQYGAVIQKDNNPAVLDRVKLFLTNGSAPAVDVTATNPVSAAYVDGFATFLHSQLVVAGSSGALYHTSAAMPATLQALSLPPVTATNSPIQVWGPLSWRVSADNRALFASVATDTSLSTEDLLVVRLNAALNGMGAPTNFTQFAAPTRIADFGCSAVTPAATNDSPSGLRAAVSPDGSKILFLAGSASPTVFPGLYLADGSPNPPLRTVPGASFYSELAFLNNSTAVFFAGPSNTMQSFYRLDVASGVITQIGTAADIQTRGQFWSLNRNWWYFVRSDAASTRNDIVSVDCATGAVNSITGSEFGTGGSVGSLHRGAFNTVVNPRAAVELQLRRAPIGSTAWFAARRFVNPSVFEDANVFRFEIESGGPAVQVTGNTGTGTSAAGVRNIENLTISSDGRYVAYSERFGTAGTSPETVTYLDRYVATMWRRAAERYPTGQTVTDRSIRFTGSPVDGVVWSVGSGSTSVPATNTLVEWLPLGSTSPVRLTIPVPGSRYLQVIGTN